MTTVGISSSAAAKGDRRAFKLTATVPILVFRSWKTAGNREADAAREDRVRKEWDRESERHPYQIR